MIPISFSILSRWKQVLSQMMHVVCGHEKTHVKIHEVVGNAGGSNQGLFEPLHDGLKLALVGVERVAPGHATFINPCDPSRTIAVFNCSTHNLKKVRNALLESNTCPEESTSCGLRVQCLGGSMSGKHTPVIGKKLTLSNRHASNLPQQILTSGKR
jgi:hypothetical protein